MPVTAKLSQKFYERFGDELTNELVDWLNQVDATYRAEFRELFEVHFGRFDAKLQQGLGEVRAELREEIAGVRTELRAEVGSLREALALQRGDLRHGLADLRTEIAASRAESLRWNFLFWIGTVGTVAALMKL